MRLLDIYTNELHEFWGEEIPAYVIASHRWSNDEPTYNTLSSHRQRNSAGWQKVLAFCERVQQYTPPVNWLWIDTVCIDKSNSVELSEAINSMFTWYRNAQSCCAYLQDVQGDTEDEICGSNWFSRGWTLQELIAPQEVFFHNQQWDWIAYKSDQQKSEREDVIHLNRAISRITSIPEEVLNHFNASKALGLRKRLMWMERRKTTKPEDTSYSLLGIFGVYMAPIYGEGAQHARKRLLKEIKDSQASDLALRIRQGGGVIIEGTDHVLPRSIFHFHDFKAGSGMYTIILRDGFYEQVFDDGEIGMQIAVGSGHRYEQYIKEAFQAAGAYAVTSAAEKAMLDLRFKQRNVESLSTPESMR